MASRSDIKAGRAYVELYIKNSALMKGLQSIRKQAQQISDEFMKMGMTLSKIGIAMAIPIALATKRFADFDDQMRTVKAVSQSSESQFQQLTDTAKRLGASTSFTAVQVAQMMTELGRAGFTADQIDVMTASVLNLARASGTDGAVAAGIMSATIRQFGLGAGDAVRVADVLTLAANATFTSVEQLGEALSYAGPVAADFGMSLESAVALLGALGNIGIQGSEGGTAIRRLLSLSAAEAQAWGDSFGVTMVDTAGNVRPLIDVLEEIRTATAGMGTAERGVKFKEAFGILGIVAGSALGKNATDVRALEKALMNAGGVAADTAKQMDAGLGGSLRRLLSAVEGVAIAIGEALAPVLMKIGEYLTPALAILKNFISQNKALIQIIAGVVVGVIALGATLLSIGAFFGTIAFATGGFTSMITLITGTISIIGTAFALLFTPIIGLTALILGLGAVIVGIAAYWLFFTDSGRAAVMGTIAVLQPLINWVMDAFQGIIDALSAGNFGLAAGIAASAIKVAFFHAVEYVTKLIFKIPHAVKAMYDSLPEWMKLNIITNAFEAGDNALGGIEAAMAIGAVAADQKLKDLLEQAKLERELVEFKSDEVKPPVIPKPDAPGAPKPPPGAAEALKSLGSFDATALVMQNWGVMPAPKKDPQAEMLKKLELLDKIYQENVYGRKEIVQAVKEAAPAWGT